MNSVLLKMFKGKQFLLLSIFCKEQVENLFSSIGRSTLRFFFFKCSSMVVLNHSVDMEAFSAASRIQY